MNNAADCKYIRCIDAYFFIQRGVDFLRTVSAGDATPQ
jgi:hypothetical protein